MRMSEEKRVGRGCSIQVLYNIDFTTTTNLARVRIRVGPPSHLLEQPYLPRCHSLEPLKSPRERPRMSRLHRPWGPMAYNAQSCIWLHPANLSGTGHEQAIGTRIVGNYANRQQTCSPRST